MSILEQFQDHLNSRTLDDYYDTHATRFRHTREKCGTLLRKARRVLELGGQSVIGTFARDTLGVSLTEYLEDLCFPLDRGDNAYFEFRKPQ